MSWVTQLVCNVWRLESQYDRMQLFVQKLPDSVRTCSKLIQLDVAANDDMDALPAGPYLSNLRDLDISRCDFHR